MKRNADKRRKLSNKRKISSFAYKKQSVSHHYSPTNRDQMSQNTNAQCSRIFFLPLSLLRARWMIQGHRALNSIHPNLNTYKSTQGQRKDGRISHCYMSSSKTKALSPRFRPSLRRAKKAWCPYRGVSAAHFSKLFTKEAKTLQAKSRFQLLKKKKST